ncbi:hypothetical protein AB1K83_09615 [Sporosarcina sp. 179-K 3D1 HS]
MTVFAWDMTVTDIAMTVGRIAMTIRPPLFNKKTTGKVPVVKVLL